MPPVAIADTNITIDQIEPGETITLEASRSYDPDHGTLSYRWTDQNDQVLGDNKSIVWTAPKNADTFTITLEVTDNEGLTDSDEITFHFGPFGEIKKLIRNAQNGTFQSVTYICVGDSTRAREEAFKGYVLFDRIKERLQQENVSSVLLAHSGEKAAYFDLIPSSDFDPDERTYQNDGYPNDFDTAGWPKWTDLTSDQYVSGDGNTTIVNISLGINDILYTDGNTSARRAARVEQNLEEAITKIRVQKPMIHFILTVPPRGYDDNQSADSETNLRLTHESAALEQAYIDLADKLHLPLIDIPARFMAEDPAQNPEWIHWFRHTIESNPPEDDTAHVHLQVQYQPQVADYILSKILPQD